MPTRNKKKWVSAQRRLKRMEERIAPYVKRKPAPKPEPRKVWMPGDALIWNIDDADQLSADELYYYAY